MAVIGWLAVLTDAEAEVDTEGAGVVLAAFADGLELAFTPAAAELAADADGVPAAVE